MIHRFTLVRSKPDATGTGQRGGTIAATTDEYHSP
jgi:hypothetical protein